jgi:hypothetical protein
MTKAIAKTNKELDDSLLLGHLFFYTLGDIKISESELEAIFVKNGLDKKYVKKINKIDAFRRATSKAKQAVTINYNGSQAKARLEMDEVRCDSDCVVRALGRKVIDEANEALSYKTVGKIVFHRDNSTVTTSVNNSYIHEMDYTDVLDETVLRYNDWSVYHTKDTVRNMSNHVLESMYPVSLMPSGLCKFIPKASKDTLYALQGVIRDLSAYGNDCLFEVVPVIDTEEQRELIDKSATKEIKEELYQFTQDLKQVITAKQTISTKSAVAYIEKFKALNAKAKEYESLLGTYMGLLTQQIQEAIALVNDNTEQ